MKRRVASGTPTRLRLEAWTTADGRLAHLLVAAGHALALAHAIVRTADGRGFVQGGAWLPPAAIEADRDAILSRLAPLGPPRAVTLDALGLLHDEDHCGIGTFDKLLELLREPRPRRLPHRPSDLREPYDAGTGFDQSPVPMNDHLPSITVRSMPGVVLARAETPPAIHDFPRHPTSRKLLSVIRPWTKGLRAAIRPPSLPRFGDGSWSAVAFRHYTAPGEAGRRRIQAAAIQPAFVATLAIDPELVRLVDAGEPFEDRLLDVLRDFRKRKSSAYGGHLDGTRPASDLTPALVRRMRTLPTMPNVNSGEACNLLDTIAGIPLDRVPDDPVTWANLVELGLHVHRATDARFNLGLDVRDLVRDIPRDWDLSRLIPDLESRAVAEADVVGAYAGMRDMARRFRETVLGPLHAAYPDRSPEPDLVDAARILFGGKGLASCWALQRRWHAGIEAFDRALPTGRLLTWPPLFEPFSIGAVTIRCLVDTDELRSEGSAAEDDDGMAGLGHCVGGYGIRCVQGISHIASIVGPGPDGRPVRLSTMEIVNEGDGTLDIAQHNGRGNADPPAAAVRAMNRFWEAFRSRSHPWNPAAIAIRPPPPPGTLGIDPALAFAAWRPYLRRSVAAAGVEALSASIRGRPVAGGAEADAA
jgi:hypothetical protein